MRIRGTLAEPRSATVPSYLPVKFLGSKYRYHLFATERHSSKFSKACWGQLGGRLLCGLSPPVVSVPSEVRCFWLKIYPSFSLEHPCSGNLPNVLSLRV